MTSRDSDRQEVELGPEFEAVCAEIRRSPADAEGYLLGEIAEWVFRPTAELTDFEFRRIVGDACIALAASLDDAEERGQR